VVEIKEATEKSKSGHTRFSTRTDKLNFANPAILVKNGVFCLYLLPGKLCPTHHSSK